MRRGTAIAVLCDVLIDARYQVEKDAINMAIEALQDRPQGKWMPTENVLGVIGGKCSKCGEGTFVLYNFCPQCGADMRGEEHVTE